MLALTADKKNDVDAQRHLAVTAGELGAALVTAGQPRDGLPYIDQSLPIFRSLYEADKTSRLARLDAVESEENAGILWVALGDPTKAMEHCRTSLQLLGTLPTPPESDLEISAAYVEAEMDLAKAYASAAQAAAAAPQRSAFWREARLSATASLQTAQAIVAKNPEIAADYAQFIAADKELLVEH
jgi:tetratricopeptide (TPR) repeat protein